MSADRRVRRGAGGLALFFTANVVFGAGLFAHAFLYNFYLDALGLGEAVMGVAAAVLTAGGLAALAPAGLLVDRFGARTVYPLAAVVGSAGLALGAFVETQWTVYGAAFVAGMGAAGWRVVMGPMLMRLAPERLRARAFSWNVGLLVGSGAVWTAGAGAVPGWLSTAFGVTELTGIRAGLLLGAAGTLVSAPLLLGAWAVGRRRGRRARQVAAGDAHGAGGTDPGPGVPERVPTGPATPGGDRGAGTAEPPGGEPPDRDGAGPDDPPAPAGSWWGSGPGLPPGLLLVVLFVAVWMTAGGLVIPFFNIYFLRVFELPIGRIGVLLALGQALTAVVIFGSGEVAGRLGPVRALTAWTVLFPPTLWLLAVAGSLELAIGLYLLQALVPPATNPLIDQILLERAPPDRQGAVSSWRNAATEASGLVGSGAGGFLLQAAGFGALFGVAGAAALVGAAGLVVGVRRVGQSRGARMSRSSRRR